ncbi:uncharacterized protein LOC115448619 [Manduca sexta]|uniref:Uncharacterized protein n=1 Tax=Manduca sexta TaxID=7130 RepID=A0A921YMG6_MANSE|nr:uncharacterized protein LOC115448619 [Manduca sexta]KAG6441924.1 hypothetical protein O3G_MSEX002049 [Manduca sexta]
MLPKIPRIEKRFLSRRSLCRSIINATELVDSVAADMYADQCRWQRTVLGHTFTVTGSSCPEEAGSGTVVSVIRTWIRTHEEAQVMLASLLVVVGLWWLVRTVLTLIINLVCPLLVVLVAVVCVPQLRTPLLGQNYSAMAALLRNILLKMADNIKA